MKNVLFWKPDVCLIVDANAAGRFLASAGPVRNWLLGETGEPRLVAAGALKEELGRLDGVRRLLVTLDRAGRLKSADADSLSQEHARLRAGGMCRSNDHHVLALAIVSGARTLATFDNALTQDFRNAAIINGPRGSVYRDPDVHTHLLRHTPTSCGVRSTGNRRWRGSS
jgi:hypothetical protein